MGAHAVVRRSKVDPDTEAYTLKRCKVTKVSGSGEVLQVTLQPDNKASKPIVVARGARPPA
jgi:hypothetical protein